MVKSRRSRQPRQWHKITHTRSNSGTLVGKQNFNLSEVTPELQAKKMRRNLDRYAKQIKKMIEEKFTSTTSSERKKELEAAILRREEKYYHATTRLMLVESKIKGRIQREKTRKANLAAEMEQAKKNAENIDKFRLTPEIQNKVETLFPSRLAQKIENQGGKRKIKTKKHNRWDAQPDVKYKTVRSGLKLRPDPEKDNIGATTAKKVELKQ